MPKLPPTFEVLFEGKGVSPASIPLTTLSRALSAVQRLASGDEELTGEGEDDDSLSLIAVRPGSARFDVAAKTPDRSLANLKLAGSILNDPSISEQIAYAFNPIEELSAIARRLQCTITLKKPSGKKDVLAVIEPDTFGRLAKNLLIEGETSITGVVERVGGATEMRCALRVPSQARLMYCKVDNKELVRQLGERLYEEVVVEGRARWLRSSWKVIGFNIKKMSQPKPGTLTDAFAALRKAGGKAWDRIPDPEKFLREVTGE